MANRRTARLQSINVQSIIPHVLAYQGGANSSDVQGRFPPDNSTHTLMDCVCMDRSAADYMIDSDVANRRV